MTKEQEAQQAQTIAEAKERIQWAANCRHVLTYTAKRNEFAVLKRRAKKFQRIIDSQAQKIADLNRVGANTLMALIESQEKIAKQAKEIERLKEILQIVSPTILQAINSGSDVRMVDIGPQLLKHRAK